MKHEPTAVTMIGIYKLLDMELDDLNAVDIQEADQAFRLLCEATEGIREEINDTSVIMQDAGEILGGVDPDPEKLHGQFTEIYRAAIQTAGKAVRLAAIARQGIIQSETMKRIDCVKWEKEGAGHGSKRKCDLCS